MRNSISWTVVIALLAAALFGPASAGAQANGESPEAAGEDDKAADYTAKNFSLVAGGVLLNQFKYRDTTPAPSPSDPNPAQRLELDKGTNAASAFLEAGARMRWAWRDREVASPDPKVARAQAEVKRLEKAKRAIEELGVSGKTLAAARAELETAEKDRDAAVSGSSRLGTSRRSARIWAGSHPAGTSDDEDLEVGAFLLPDDFEIRLGYAFGEDTDQTPVSIAGKSEVFTEAFIGWNLLRFGDGGSNGRPPIRGSFNFEGGLGLTTDKEVDDIHARVFVGPALALGVPVKMGEGYPIVEVVARAGAVRVETPVFASKATRELEIEHGRPDFRGGWGFGMDVDFNVPVPNDLGYLMLRGRLNSNFDPNPWSVTLGYTIPLTKIFEGFAGGGD